MAVQTIPTETTPISSTRPTIITALCVLFFIGILRDAWLLSSGAYERYGVQPIWGGADLILASVVTVGLWKMRRWAAIAFTAQVIIGEVILLFTGNWLLIVGGFVVWSSMTAICLSYYPKMR